MAFDEISYGFVRMVAATQGSAAEWFKYVFASCCRYVEEQLQLQIIIEEDDSVPRRSAIGVRQAGKFIIGVNPQDVLQAPVMVRLRIAHELGHLCCGHDEELLELMAWDKGDTAQPQGYSDYRQVSENEAEVFALNMLYARGGVVEREILADSEFNTQVINGIPLIAALGTNPGMPNLASILNQANFRERMRRKLRQQGYLLSPVPVLCKSLREVLPRFGVHSGSSRRMALAIHHDYRDKLRQRIPSVQPSCELSCDLSMERDRICPE